MPRIYGFSESEIQELAAQAARRAARRAERREARANATWIAPEHAKFAKDMKRDWRHQLVIDPRPTLLVKRAVATVMANLE